MQSLGDMRRTLLGALLLCSATALARPPGDAPPPAPTGPSGDAGPVDPYANPSTPPPPSTNVPPSPESPAAPAPSQQQAPAQAPAPNTTPPDAKPQPPASEQKPLPPIDKPAPAPVDQPHAPTPEHPAQSGSAQPGSAGSGPETTLAPPGETAPIAPSAALIDVANAPPACRDAGSRVSSRDHNTALASKVSFAICTASSAMASLSLVDAEASVRDLDHATANAFALLDEVAAAGDPRWQIVALHAEGDLLDSMTRRMLATVPPAKAGAPQSAIALRDSRLQLLQAHLDPWIQRAQQAFAQVDQLARANPQLTQNQLVATAVADSRRRLTTGVATR